MRLRDLRIREQVDNGEIEIAKCDGISNPADAFTKPLGREKFLEYRTVMGVEKIPDSGTKSLDRKP